MVIKKFSISYKIYATEESFGGWKVDPPTTVSCVNYIDAVKVQYPLLAQFCCCSFKWLLMLSDVAVISEGVRSSQTRAVNSVLTSGYVTWTCETIINMI